MNNNNNDSVYPSFLIEMEDTQDILTTLNITQLVANASIYSELSVYIDKQRNLLKYKSENNEVERYNALKRVKKQINLFREDCLQEICNRELEKTKQEQVLTLDQHILFIKNLSNIAKDILAIMYINFLTNKGIEIKYSNESIIKKELNKIFNVDLALINYIKKHGNDEKFNADIARDLFEKAIIKKEAKRCKLDYS